MKISIVTLSFNQRSYLRDTLDSVLDQNYPELEYIVVDPGSTDGSRELIESYKGALAHTLFAPDKGPADGLNKGFEFATGDIYGFLNSDDRLLPGSLQTVADFFQSHRECDLAMGNGYKVDAGGRRFKEVRARDYTVRRHLYGGTRWLQQSTFFRRETYIRSSGFNIENSTCWDAELFLNMICQGARVGYISSHLSEFRIHDTSISGTGRLVKTYNQDLMRMFRQVKRREWGLTDDLWKFLYRVEGAMLRTGDWIVTVVRRNAA